MARPAPEVAIEVGGAAHYTGGGSQYLIQTPSGVLYCVFINVASDVVFAKSTDYGITWSEVTSVFAGTATQLSVWYDRWSNISAGLIHCAYAESVTDDVLYRSIDTENSDTLGTQTTIFAGLSTSSNSSLSITRARGGNLGCYFNIDGGTEDGFSRSTDVGANWGARADSSEASTDWVILMPGWAADNQDMMLFFWDASADEISRKLYDDSANSWDETSIATTMVDSAPSNGWPHFAAAVDITNSRNVLVAWSAVDGANADLRCWTVTESAITEVTAVVSNGTDDQGLCAIAIDTNTAEWWVFYAGKSDGSETFSTAMNIYYKISNDSGSTWSAETALTTAAKDRKQLTATPRFFGKPTLGSARVTTGSSVVLVYVHPFSLSPRANFQLGI